MLNIKTFLADLEKQSNTTISEEYTIPQTDNISKEKAEFTISNKNLSGLEYNIAQCCKPVLGDKIIGFVTIGRGISIHRANCPNAIRMKETLSYRQVDVEWRSESESVQTNISLSGIDKPGLFHDISKVDTKDLKVNIQSISVNSDHGKLIGNIKVFATNSDHLDILIKRLLEVDGVSKALRNDD